MSLTAAFRESVLNTQLTQINLIAWPLQACRPPSRGRLAPSPLMAICCPADCALFCKHGETRPYRAEQRSIQTQPNDSWLRNRIVTVVWIRDAKIVKVGAQSLEILFSAKKDKLLVFRAHSLLHLRHDCGAAPRGRLSTAAPTEWPHTPGIPGTPHSVICTDEG